MAKTDRQILQAARQRLRTGWVKREWFQVEIDGVTQAWHPGVGFDYLKDLLKKANADTPNPDCKVCAKGAIYLACAEAGDTNDSRATQIIASLDRNADSGDAILVNDAPSSTLEDVLAVYDKTEKEFSDAA